MTQGIPYVECLASIVGYIVKANNVSRSEEDFNSWILTTVDAFRNYRRLKQRYVPWEGELCACRRSFAMSTRMVACKSTSRRTYRYSLDTSRSTYRSRCPVINTHNSDGTQRRLTLIIDVLSWYGISPVKRFLKRRDILNDLQKCEKDITMTVEEFNVCLWHYLPV